MARAGDNGGIYHQLDGSQHLFLDAWTTQMQRLLNRNKEEPYKRIAKSSSFTLKPLSPREVCDDQNHIFKNIQNKSKIFKYNILK